MIGTMTPFTFADVSSIWGKSFRVRVPWKKPMMMVVMTATAADSVGVKIPE